VFVPGKPFQPSLMFAGTFSIMDLVVSLSTSIECHHAECRFLFVVMLSVGMLNVVAPLSLHLFSIIYQRMDSSTSLVFHGKNSLARCRQACRRPGLKEQGQWKRINRKQSARWQHLSQLKASAFLSLREKNYFLRDTTTYTWDW